MWKKTALVFLGGCHLALDQPLYLSQLGKVCEVEVLQLVLLLVEASVGNLCHLVQQILSRIPCYPRLLREAQVAMIFSSPIWLGRVAQNFPSFSYNYRTTLMSVFRHIRVGFHKDQATEIIFQLALFILNRRGRSPKNNKEKYFFHIF